MRGAILLVMIMATRRVALVRVAVVVLVAVGVLGQVVSCGYFGDKVFHHSGVAESVSKPKLHRIVLDKTFVEYVLEEDGYDTPDAVAGSLMTDSSKRFTKTYAESDGDVVATMTDAQLRYNHKDDRDAIAGFEREFSEANPDFRYELSKDRKTWSVWLQNDMQSMLQVKILGGVPVGLGWEYYLDGHTGPWSIRVNVYNCHSNELKLSILTPFEGHNGVGDDYGD